MTHLKEEWSWLNPCSQLVCISIETNYLFVLLLYGHVYLGRSGILVTVFLSHAWSGMTSNISWGGSSYAANLAWEIIPRLHFHSHFIQAPYEHQSGMEVNIRQANYSTWVSFSPSPRTTAGKIDTMWHVEKRTCGDNHWTSFIWNGCQRGPSVMSEQKSESR